MCIDSLNGFIYFAVGNTKLVAINRHMELVKLQKIAQKIRQNLDEYHQNTTRRDWRR